MKTSHLLNNVIIALTFGIGIFFPATLVFDAILPAGAIGTIAGLLFLFFLMRRAKEMEKTEGKGVQENVNRYMRRFAVTMLAYMVLLMTSIYLIERVDAQALKIVISILPILPVSYGLWAFMDWLRNLDEFQKQIQMEAIAFSLGMTGIVTFTIGFLENAGVPQPGLIWVFPMTIMFWQVGQMIASRRYE